MDEIQHLLLNLIRQLSFLSMQSRGLLKGPFCCRWDQQNHRVEHRQATRAHSSCLTFKGPFRTVADVASSKHRRDLIRLKTDVTNRYCWWIFMTAVIIVSSSTKRSVVHISRGAIRGYFLLSPVLDSDDWVHLPLMKLDLRDCGRLTIDMTGSNDDSVYRDSSGTPQAFERGRSRSSFFLVFHAPTPLSPPKEKGGSHRKEHD